MCVFFVVFLSCVRYLLVVVFGQWGLFGGNFLRCLIICVYCFVIFNYYLVLCNFYVNDLGGIINWYVYLVVG